MAPTDAVTKAHFQPEHELIFHFHQTRNNDPLPYHRGHLGPKMLRKAVKANLLLHIPNLPDATSTFFYPNTHLWAFHQHDRVDIGLLPYEVYTTTVDPIDQVDSLVYLSKHSLQNQQLPSYSLLPSFLYTPFHLHAFVPPNSSLKPK
ncbi:hypothetical protein H5410_028707 [Solanum commersonii]|uniref:Uncharacterized protein n=1 Tax=Solanum commersonii TaxID=4109 RepID=A0A9J5Z5P1_SOLCO|nr:hypothetical protein H5410_028707 [Solanum commersonii]